MSVEHEALTRAKEKMEKTEKVLANELVSIRAGRANPKLLEKIMVDYYGASTPITQVGNVASPRAAFAHSHTLGRLYAQSCRESHTCV